MEDNIQQEHNFKSKLLFLNEVFSNTYPKDVIMSSCIQYKLRLSFEDYEKSLNNSLWLLHGEDTLAILKRIDN